MNQQLPLFDLPKTNTETLTTEPSGKPRINKAVRNQVELITACLDDYISDEHPARNIWAYIEQMDLTPFLRKIQSTEGHAGRKATDPKILLALWIYAIVEGIGSARVIDRYCTEHLAFKWICGGVSLNYHTISDFRRNNAQEFDELISLSIARLMERNLVTLKRVSQDGMKVRAAAGSASFRRKPRLKELLAEAKERVKTLREELDQDPSICINRQAAAKKRATEDRQKRIEQALSEHQKLIISKGKAKKKERKQFKLKEKQSIRASTTDPEARKMKMGNGGFNPAYNMQAVVDTHSRFIVNGYVTNRGVDFNELNHMIVKLKKDYKKVPEQYLVDQGYLEHDAIIKAQNEGAKVYVKPCKHGKKDIYAPRENEDEQLSEWRVRMGMDEAKEIYKDRASNSEWANAGMRNRGLKNLLVRGLDNVKSVFSLHILTHNIQRAISLRYAW